MLWTDSVREARLAAGLSQAALAAAAGISRQAVGAIEAGRHRPSVDAALAIARAVGRPVETIFGIEPEDCQPVVGGAARQGAPILVSRVGDRVTYAPASDALAFQGWPLPNAVLDGGRPRLLSGADLDAMIVVGCDPALGLAAAMLPSAGPRRVIALSGSTATALEAMAAGRAHAALVHNAPGRLPPAPPGTLRLHLARWRVGIANRGRRARSVAELCAGNVRVVQREPGASIQRAFASAAAAAGAATPAGPLASGHLEVARRVACGARAGVTMQPAALMFGLAFAELEEHVVELWVDARWRGHPAVGALGELLRSRAFTTRMELVGGYEMAGCGREAGGTS